MIPSRRNRRPRQGFTLRELALAISIGSVVMMSAVGLVHHAFDWSTLARHRRTDDQTCFLLGCQLRDDVRLAASASVSSEGDAPATLQLELADDAVVTYSVESSGVSRIESKSDAVVRRDDFRFKRARQVSFAFNESDPQVSLEITSVTPHESEPPVWRVIRASVGLRLRHQQGDIEG